jgi:hypothetical protein
MALGPHPATRRRAGPRRAASTRSSLFRSGRRCEIARSGPAASRPALSGQWGEAPSSGLLAPTADAALLLCRCCCPNVSSVVNGTFHVALHSRSCSVVKWRSTHVEGPISPVSFGQLSGCPVEVAGHRLTQKLRSVMGRRRSHHRSELSRFAICSAILGRRPYQ